MPLRRALPENARVILVESIAAWRQVHDSWTTIRDYALRIGDAQRVATAAGRLGECDAQIAAAEVKLAELDADSGVIALDDEPERHVHNGATNQADRSATSNDRRDPAYRPPEGRLEP